jgi:hypothetical protein
MIAGAIAASIALSACWPAAVLGQVDAAVETRQSDADSVRSQFLARLRRVSDVGDLFEPKTVAHILGVKLESSVAEREVPLSCTAHFRTTTLTAPSTSWFHSLSSGVGHVPVPAFTINPATVTGDPELSYEIIHYVYCGEWSRLQDGRRATLTFNGLPAFNCLKPSQIRAAIPGVKLRVATDGVYLVEYRGRLDDTSGTTLTFNFRAGVACALSARVSQDQEAGLRYRRAQFKFETCRVAADRAFCSAHPDFAWGDTAMLAEMNGNAVAKCGNVNAIYLKEPANGARPPPLPQRIRRSPCDGPGATTAPSD